MGDAAVFQHEEDVVGAGEVGVGDVVDRDIFDQVDGDSCRSKHEETLFPIEEDSAFGFIDMYRVEDDHFIRFGRKGSDVRFFRVHGHFLPCFPLSAGKRPEDEVCEADGCQDENGYQIVRFHDQSVFVLHKDMEIYRNSKRIY